MKKILVLGLICLLFCIFGCNNTSSETTYENFISEYSVIKYITKHINEVEIKYDFNLQKCYTNINEVEIVFDTQNSVILENNIKLPYKFTFDKKEYASYCMYEIEESEAGTLFSFDDYFSGNWDNVIAYFYDNGMKATWFCYGDTSRKGLLNFMKFAQLHGQEIGFHTKLHKRMDTMSVDEIEETAITPLDKFAAEGIEMHSISLPNSKEPNEEGMKLLKENYKIIRSGGDGGKFHIYTPEEIKKGFIYGQSIDWVFFKDDEKFKMNVQNWLIIAKLTGTIWPAFTHYFLESEDSHYYSGGQIYDNYTIKYSNLIYIFDLVKHLKMKSYTYSDFY